MAGLSSVGGGPKPQFSLAFDANDRPGKVTAARQASARAPQGPSLPPGGFALTFLTEIYFIICIIKLFITAAGPLIIPNMTFSTGASAELVAAATKSAKKRASKKKGEEGASEEGNTANLTASAAASMGSLSIEPQQSDNQAPEDPAKRIRAIQKKLRQVSA